MPLEHLQFLSIFQADDVILGNGFRDGYRGFWAGWCLSRSALDRHQRQMNFLNQCRQCRGRDSIMGSVSRYNLRRKS